MFYRCFAGVSNAFLCAAQRGGGRLWWTQHGLSQNVPEDLARCAFPCDTGRRCSSAGGILVESGTQISESQQEAETAFRQSPCSNQTSLTGPNTGGSQTGVNTGAGTGQTGPGQQPQPQPQPQPGSGQTGTGQAGSGSSNPGGERLCMVSWFE